jgi:hypothetical protein
MQEAVGLPVLYQLKSSCLIAKFSSVFGIPFSLIQDHQASRDTIKILSSPRAFKQAIRAFRQHPSQARWFRNLYCLCSRYLWWNELRLYKTLTWQEANVAADTPRRGRTPPRQAEL